MDPINDTPVGGVALRDSSLLTTSQRNALAERARAAARRQRERGMQERLDLIEHQIANAAHRRLQAWSEAARTGQGVGHLTTALGERLRDLYNAKSRLAAGESVATLPNQLRKLDVKLTEADVREIRNDAARGVARIELAKRFAVSQRYVRDVLENKLHVDPDYVPGCPLEGGTITRRRRHPTRAAGDYRRDGEDWLWLRGVTRQRRPAVKYNGRSLLAARVYYELAYGPVADGMKVVRTCGNTMCVNPRHGRVVTAAEMSALGAKSKRCPDKIEARVRGERRAKEVRSEVAPLIERAYQEAAEVTARKDALWLVWSLDAPLPNVVADVGAVDPFEVVAASELRDILGDLDEASIDALPEDELLDLRERLLAADFAPSTVMAMA